MSDKAFKFTYKLERILTESQIRQYQSHDIDYPEIMTSEVAAEIADDNGGAWCVLDDWHAKM